MIKMLIISIFEIEKLKIFLDRTVEFRGIRVLDQNIFVHANASILRIYLFMDKKLIFAS